MAGIGRIEPLASPTAVLSATDSSRPEADFVNDSFWERADRQ
jgi:hypothetical protein